MSLHQDWEGIAQEKTRGWEAAVRQRQWQAQIPRRRSTWRRWAGAGLMRLGGWLTHWGEAMAAKECPPHVSTVG